MAPPIGTHQVAFGSTAINRLQDITHAPMGALDKLKRAFSTNSQLFVPNTHGNFIATGVSRSDLRKLQQVNVSAQGSMRLGSIDAARKILTASGISPGHVTKLPAEQAVALARSISANGPHAQAWAGFLESIAQGFPDPKALSDFVKTMDTSLGAAPPFADITAAKTALTTAGVPLALVNSLPPERAIALAKFSATNSPHFNAIVNLEQAVSAGTLSGKVVDRVINMCAHSPQLAGKVIHYANQELAGAPNFPRGIAEFTSRIAERDSRLMDLRGYPRPGEMPTAATLGFTPHLHVKLPPTDYAALKQQIQRHQAAYGTMSKMAFDDVNHRVDIGYSVEELETMERGQQSAPVPPPVGPDISTDMTKTLQKILVKSPDFVEDNNVICPGMDVTNTGPHFQDHYSFGNPTYLDQRQSARLDAIGDTFRAYGSFDYSSYDATITPTVNNQLQTFASGNTNTALIDEILQTRNLPGFSIGEEHPQRETKDFIANNMAHLLARDVRVIGLEHLNVEGIQAEVDRFLDPTFVGPMPQELESKLRGLSGPAPKDTIVNIINAAKANPPMQVVGINANNLRPTTTRNNPDAMPIRDATMNAVGQTALEQRITSAQLTTPNAKFVTLVGRAHNKSHEGLFENGIPGFPQMFDVPGFDVGKKATGATDFPITLSSDDPTQRKNTDPIAGPALNQFLGELSGKTATIFNSLSPDLQVALDERVSGSSVQEQAQIKELLHFGITQRGDTTTQSRVEIRTALAQGLAKGLPLDQLTNLRELLVNTDPTKLGPLVGDLNNADMLTGAALSKNLMDVRADDARETFATLRPMLTFGETDATKANQGIYADQNIALRRDATGALQIANVDVAFAKVDVPTTAGNHNLDATAIDNLKDIFRQFASTPYSHQAVMLDFAEHFRTQKATNPGLTMKQAMDSFTPDGAISMAKYGRGDCICQAEAIVEHLRNLNPPVTAYIGGVNNTGLTRQKFGDRNMVGTRLNYQYDAQPKNIDGNTSAVTHTEVLIPYTDANGVEKVLGFTTGGGPQDKWISENDLSTGGLVGGASGRLDPNINPDGTRKNPTAPIIPPPEMRVRISPDGDGLDTKEIQKAQFGFRSVVHLVNTDPTVTDRTLKQNFAINFLEGTIALSTPMADRLTAKKITFPGMTSVPGGDVNFNYRDALAHPNDPVNLIVPDRNNPGATKTVQITKLQSLNLFLRAVQKMSGQTDTFRDNVATLLSNEAEYGRDILMPDVAKVGQTMLPQRTAALNNRPPNDPRLTAWRTLMNDATTAINAGNFDTGIAKFQEAATL